MCVCERHMHTHACLSQMEDSASHDKLNKNRAITTDMHIPGSK